MVKFTQEENRVMCNFPKRLDSEYCINNAQVIYDKIENLSGKLVFDLKDVDYISSAFLAICIKAAKDLGKENFSMINVSPSVKKVFKISKLDNLINIL